MDIASPFFASTPLIPLDKETRPLLGLIQTKTVHGAQISLLVF